MNTYGNIEIWGGLKQFVPLGAVYVEGQLAVKAAKMLDLQYAPALIGFENKGLGSYPKIGGVVILEEYQALVLDAMYQMEAAKEEVAYQEKFKKMIERWYKLVKMLLSRQKLRETYGE